MQSMFYYSSWSLMIIVSIWLTIEVKIWSNFLKEIRKTFFSVLISLMIIFISLNIIGLIYSINFPNNLFSEIIRIYFPVLSVIVLGFMMRIVNKRSLNFTAKTKELLRTAAEHIAYNNDIK
jgi:uncharacterized protein YacL